MKSKTVVMKMMLQILAALVLAGMQNEAFGAEVPVGDRHPAVNMVYPENAFYHAGKGGRIIDVTKAPFFAQGNGVSDDTGALVAAVDFIFRTRREAFCARDRSLGSYVLYFPNGIYRVSNTVAKNLPVRVGALPFSNYIQYWVMDEKEIAEDRSRFPHAVGNKEQNDSLILIGQNREKTIIRLDDNCPGFEEGQSKPVLAYYLLKTGSNVNQDNVLKNITIDTGKGNPGAVGVRWNAANTGGIRNVTIRSGDGAGVAGLLGDTGCLQGLLEDISIIGFGQGMFFDNGQMSILALDHITLSDQTSTSISLNDAQIAGRKILVENTPTALTMGKNRPRALIMDSEFRCSGNERPAIETSGGFLFVRNLKTSGCSAAIVSKGEVVEPAGTVAEYLSTAVVSVAGSEKGSGFSGLPVEEIPALLTELTAESWANVDDFGAVGDGVSDDTAAIQRAMDSGKPAVIFPRVAYTINGTVRIPKSVRRISFLYGHTFRAQEGGGAMFCVAEASNQPLLIEQNVNAGGLFLDHEADRIVVLNDCRSYFVHTFRGENPIGAPVLPWKIVKPDMKTNVWRLYRNATPNGAKKKVFVNNCLGFAPGGTDARCAVENVQVWGRFLNTEHYGVELSFKRSDVWILGFKSEINSTYFHIEDNSRLEVLGGVYYTQKASEHPPVVVVKDSQCRIFVTARGHRTPDDIILQNIRDGKETLIMDKQIKTMPSLSLIVN